MMTAFTSRRNSTEAFLFLWIYLLLAATVWVWVMMISTTTKATPFAKTTDYAFSTTYLYVGSRNYSTPNDIPPISPAHLMIEDNFRFWVNAGMVGTTLRLPMWIGTVLPGMHPATTTLLAGCPSTTSGSLPQSIHAYCLR
ncbi:unknown protein [Seminavis robusta]|uniref:Uncharacterized protein n=1 Tax=Seminavis robusta TaxID=568900 RepID=A0A9N8ESQ1_9STRA|nr:unknown protein [Seminavis robusta]|eukprot:Sro1846_g301340.1 n/a (140) ;mRNA; f:4610-5029